LDNRYQINKCAVILLAAGASTRLGTAKQLLRFKGKSLLQNMVSAAMDTSFRPVIVVVGANATPIINELNDVAAGLNEKAVQIINNNDWQEGIASSIRCGIQSLEKMDPSPDAAVIMVCDQPHITAALLNGLLYTQKKTGKPIVASSYNGTTGTPALFHKTFFPELLSLTGDRGAGKMLQQQIASVALFPFPDGAVDIDTIENYENLLQGN
jgi:molybdenum cofactor cytidylyltransferase